MYIYVRHKLYNRVIKERWYWLEWHCGSSCVINQWIIIQINKRDISISSSCSSWFWRNKSKQQQQQQYVNFVLSKRRGVSVFRTSKKTETSKISYLFLIISNCYSSLYLFSVCTNYTKRHVTVTFLANLLHKTNMSSVGGHGMLGQYNYVIISKLNVSAGKQKYPTSISLLTFRVFKLVCWDMISREKLLEYLCFKLVKKVSQLIDKWWNDTSS